MRTAVVIIHGIGEQKPMDTLRNFVEAIVGVREGRQNYRSKPDPLSELFELRRLQATGRDGAHFYEYYWAYNVEGTNVVDVIRWLTGLALRPGRDVPPTARSLWLLARVLGITFLALAVTGVVGHGKQWFDRQLPFGLAWSTALVAFMTVQYFLVRFLGDAARYLSPRPQNIRLRQRVRSEGVRLLRTLHDRGEYDRIVIVAHSLGSVIGYDLITRLWHEYGGALPAITTDSETQKQIRMCMQRGLPVQPVVRDELSLAGDALTPGSSKDRLRHFREAQVRAQREQRRLGHPWRITDFITLGCPLAHAMLFLASGSDDFDARKVQRELPTCPPQRDSKGYAFSAPSASDVGEDKKFTPLLLHDGAPFAVTRWTNLYFQARFGLWGDFVGGPVGPALGYGVEDVPVRTRSWFLDHTVLAHLRYWKSDPSTTPTQSRGPMRFALDQLRESLALSDRKSFRPMPWTQDVALAAPATATDGQESLG